MDLIDNVSPEQKRAIISEMRRQPELLESNGDCWSEDDIQILCDLYDEGWGVTDLALKIGRTENAVWLRLNMCGKLQRNGARKERTRTVTCKCSLCSLREDCERYNSSADIPQGTLFCFSNAY